MTHTKQKTVQKNGPKTNPSQEFRELLVSTSSGTWTDIGPHQPLGRTFL